MHWKEEKKEFQSLPTFKESVATMLEMNASINFYMFHGKCLFTITYIILIGSVMVRYIPGL